MIGPMRFASFAALALVPAVTGCLQQPADPGPYGGGPYPGGSPGGAAMCHADSDCGGTEICASDGECLVASETQTVHVTWTLNGAAASATSCASMSDLEITFTSQLETYGYAPVPCVEGAFTVLKLPINYTEVGLGPNANATSSSGMTYAAIANGSAAIDLP
jgi:hypothetical protein